MVHRILAALLALALCGCAGLQDQGGAKGANAKTIDTNSSSKRSIDISPLTTIMDTDVDSKKTAAKENSYNQSYTRLKISSQGLSGDEKLGDGIYAPGNKMKLFGSKNTCSVNLAAKVSIGAYQATIPLLTLSHGNDNEGEKWRQVIAHKLLNYPLFLIKGDGRDSIPEIRLTLSGDKSVNSNAASLALGLTVAALQIVSPEAKVLTTLTAESTKNKATAIDNTINRLFSTGIAEEHLSHRDLRLLNDKGGFKVLLQLPTKECTWNSQELSDVGMWTIGFDAPRPSVFSNWRICSDGESAKQLCAADRKSALAKTWEEVKGNPGKVLNFQISTGSTPELSSIRAYLVQKPWYIAAENAFDGKAKDQGTAEGLCKNIFNEMTGLGLNGDDAGFVVWAVATGMPHAQNIAPNAFSGTYCNSLVNKKY